MHSRIFAVNLKGKGFDKDRFTEEDFSDVSYADYVDADTDFEEDVKNLFEYLDKVLNSRGTYNFEKISEHSFRINTNGLVKSYFIDRFHKVLDILTDNGVNAFYEYSYLLKTLISEEYGYHIVLSMDTYAYDYSLDDFIRYCIDSGEKFIEFEVFGSMDYHW